MGTMIGHVAPGFGFLMIGLWHLFNHIKTHALHPNLYKSSPWFQTSIIRHLELYFIMVGSSLSIAMELFIAPSHHQPFDRDGTIPSNHLHNFEHSAISMSFIVYAVFAIVLDKLVHQKYSRQQKNDLTQLLASIAFANQLLLFRLHSTDHLGVEGQYHLLLQVVVLVSLTTTLMGIGFPNSFLVSFVRSLSIMFQGVWFMVMGFMLWTPSFMAKGCFMHFEDGHNVVRCTGEAALHRAKSLVNIEFSCYLIAVTVFGMLFYLCMVKKYGEMVEYSSLIKDQQVDDVGDEEDVKSQIKVELSEFKSFIHMGKDFGTVDRER